jgi:hypothetical protein
VGPSDNLAGRLGGDKRSLVAHLPAKVRDALDTEVERLRTTRGILIMRVLRDQRGRGRQRLSVARTSLSRWQGCNQDVHGFISPNPEAFGRPRARACVALVAGLVHPPEGRGR